MVKISYKKGGREKMKLMKKLIVLLLIIFSVFSVIGMSKVYAKDPEKKDYLNGEKENTKNKVDITNLEVGKEYFIRGNNIDYGHFSNLFCAEKGQHMYSTRFVVCVSISYPY